MIATRTKHERSVPMIVSLINSNFVDKQIMNFTSN